MKRNIKPNTFLYSLFITNFYLNKYHERPDNLILSRFSL